MLRIIICQVKNILRSFAARAVFLVVFAVVLYNFFNNVFAFQGYDVIGMYHPMRLLTLSYDHAANYKADAMLLLIQLLPLLLCLPAGLSIAADQSTGMDHMHICRLGASRYLLSRLIAVFLATFLVFDVPFLLEFLLNCISFPSKAAGDFEHLSMYDPRLAEKIAASGFQTIYKLSPYLYALWKIVLFGLTAGFLAVITAAFSAAVRVRYRVFLLLPTFSLLSLSNYFGSRSTQWYLYVSLFCNEPRQPLLPFVFILTGMLLIGIFYSLGVKKDCLK